jgi:hypothetical protein
LAGEFINGYAFGDLEKVKLVIKTVQGEATSVPDLKTTYPGVEFVDEATWKKTSEDLAKELDGLLEMIDKDADKIRAARKRNGIEGKYSWPCGLPGVGVGECGRIRMEWSGGGSCG